MRRVLSLLVLTLSAMYPSFAQTPFMCPAGLQPDGYVDFSGMPTAPNQTFNTASPAFSATLPVQGVSGLTVTVNIPSFTSSNSGPLYTVNEDSLIVNATNFDMTLTFNQPVRGVGVTGVVQSETFDTYNITADSGAVPAYYNTSAGGFAQVLIPNYNVPLQLVARFDPSQPAPASFRTVHLPFQSRGDSTAKATYQNLRVQSTNTPDPATLITQNGLMQWLRADTGAGLVWKDQSGQGHDASNDGTHVPVVQGTFNGPSCQNVLDFRNNEYYNFNLPISGWSQMTVFLVARRDNDLAGGQFGSESSAIFWNENQYWGNTYVSPYQSHVDFRFGTTQVGNYPNYVRPTTVGGDLTITRAVHNQDTDTLYVNGIKVFSQGGKLPALGGMDGTGFIGRGFNNTYFDGEIGEILVYNRVLSPDETAGVESYLRNKFGLH